MKKILYISYDGMTDPLGQSQVIPYLAGLTRLGYRIHLLSVEKKDRLSKYGEKIRGLLNESGIEWSNLLFSSRPPIISKIYDQGKLNRRALAICQQEQIGLIHARSYVAAGAAMHVAGKMNTPFLFDMRGFWVDERVDSGLWKLNNPLFRLIYKRYKRKEQEFFNSSAHIISLTEAGKTELVGRYRVPAEKITVIPCCVDLGLFDFNRYDEEAKTMIRERIGVKPGTKIVSYLGSLGGWYLAGEMLEFFRSFQIYFPGSVFLVITKDKKEEILSLAKEKGIDEDSIRVFPAERNEVPGFLSVSDWNLFFIKDAYSKKGSSPTKLGEVMAMGIPVICNDIGDTGAIVRSSGAGILVDNFQPESLQKACESLNNRKQDDPHAIREYAGLHFDLSEGIRRYHLVYKTLLGE